MDDLQALYLIIGIYLLYSNYRTYFFSFIISLTVLMNYQHVYSKGKVSTKKIIKFVFVLVFDYLFFIENNPFYNFLFVFLPFRNFFKGVYILIFSSMIMCPELKTKVQTNFITKHFHKNYFLKSMVKKVAGSKKRCFLFYITMSLLHYLVFLYKVKYFIYFFPKSSFINPNEKYYIAANLYNNQEVLPDWIEQMKLLIDYLGNDKVYVSIYENGDSTDNTTQLLLQFKDYLNEKKIINKIFTNHVVDRFKFPRVGEELEPGEVDTEEKKTNRFWKKFYRELAERVSFLAILRNKAMDFLYEIPDIDFDNTRVLFFNDIIYNYQDIISLINTNNRDYDVACGMDYFWAFYDSFVSIDLNGHRCIDHFPYFANKAAADRYIDGDPIRVFSCWNGVVSVRGKVFENKTVKFRNITKKLEYPTSECTLFNYDNWVNGYGKVLINPNLYFSYKYDCYYVIKYISMWTYEVSCYFETFFKHTIFRKDYRMTDMESPKIEMSRNLTNLTVALGYEK